MLPKRIKLIHEILQEKILRVYGLQQQPDLPYYREMCHKILWIATTEYISNNRFLLKADILVALKTSVNIKSHIHKIKDASITLHVINAKILDLNHNYNK